jgi:ubiquitin C-terminal hydrolase
LIIFDRSCASYTHDVEMMYTRTNEILFVAARLFSSDLNMSPYCSSNSDSSQSRYDLFGIINHRGSAWFGHYTSYARLLASNDSAKTDIGKSCGIVIC